MDKSSKKFKSSVSCYNKDVSIWHTELLVSVQMQDEPWSRKSLEQSERPVDVQPRSSRQFKELECLNRETSIFWVLPSQLLKSLSEYTFSILSHSHISKCFSQFASPSLCCSVETTGLKWMVSVEYRVLLWGSTTLHSSGFSCWEFMFSQRSFWAAAETPSFFNTHSEGKLLYWLEAKVSTESEDLNS